MNGCFFQVGLRDFSLNLSSPLSSTQTSTIPILTKATSDFNQTNASRLLSATIGSDMTSQKMSPGRARARPTFAKLSGMDDSAKTDFLHGHFQWPVSSSNQKIATLLTFQVSEFHIIVDPKVYEWALYNATSKFLSTKLVSVDSTSDVGGAVKRGGTVKGGANKSLQTGTSDRETRKFSTKNVETLKDVVDVSLSKKALAFISTWFPTLNATLVQVIVENFFFLKFLFSLVLQLVCIREFKHMASLIQLGLEI